MIRPKTIRLKMILYILPAVFVVFAATAILMLWTSIAAEKECATTGTMARTRRYASEFDAQMQAHRAIARTLAETMERYTSADRQEVLGILRQIFMKNPGFLGTYVIYEPDAFDGKDVKHANSPGADTTGRFLPYWNRLHGPIRLEPMMNVDLSDCYTIPKHSTSDQILEPYLYSGTLMTSFISPIIKKGRFVGVAGIDIALSNIDKIISKIKIFDTGYAFLISRTGVFVSYPDKSFIGTRTLEQLSRKSKNPVLAKISADVMAGKEGLVKTIDPVSGRETVMFYTPVKTGDWGMVVAAPVGEMFAAAHKMMNIMILISLLALGVIGIFILFAADSLARPIMEMSNVADRIGAGDLDVKVSEQDGEIGILALAFNNMTARLRENLVALHDSEEQFRSLIENGSDIITLLDGKGIIRYQSPSLKRILGYQPEALLGKSVFDFMHPDDVKRIRGKFECLLEKDAVSSAEEYRFLSHNGAWRTLESIGHNRLADAAVAGIVVNSRDITERKRMEMELRVLNQKLNDIIEFLPDATFVIDKDKKVIAWNKALEAMTGVLKSEILGKGDHAYAVPFYGVKRPILIDLIESREYLGSKYDFVTKSGGAVLTEVYVPSLYNGRGAYVAGIASALLDSQGNTVGAIESVRDITERKRVAKALQESYERLQRSMNGIISAITAIVETRDPYTAGHQKRVSLLASAIAKDMGLSADMIDGIRIAAVLHDIGKIYVPAEILSKPGVLSTVEFNMIKTHPQASYDILKSIEFPWPVAEIALEHQERFNGSGYPRGLAGKDIMLEARILSVADVVEAIMFHRPYRTAGGEGKALDEILRNKGILYDPTVVDVCIRLFKEGHFTFDHADKAECIKTLY